MPIDITDSATGEQISVSSPEIAEQGIIDGKLRFSPDQDVFVKDVDKGVLKVSGKEANANIFAQTPGLVLASDEDVSLAVEGASIGGVGQQVGAFAQGAIQGATLGLGLPAIKGAISAIEPKGSTVSSSFSRGIERRSNFFKKTELAGEVAGIFTDPLAVNKKVSELAIGAVSKSSRLASKALSTPVIKKITPSVADAIISSKLGKSIIKEGAKLGLEGSVFSGSTELGRQLLRDDLPINPEAIIGSAAEGLVVGGALGGAIGSIAPSVSKVKNDAKTFLDRVTGQAKKSTKSFTSEVESSSLVRTKGLNSVGTSKPAIEAIEDGGVFVHKDGNSLAEIPKVTTSSSVDLSTKEGVLSVESELGLKNIDIKLKNKLKTESVADVLKREHQVSQIDKEIDSLDAYLSANERAELDFVRKQEADLFSPQGTFSRKKYDDIVTTKEDLFLSTRGEDIVASDVFGQLEKKSSRIVDDFINNKDSVISVNQDGKRVISIFNNEAIPKTITRKTINLGLSELSPVAKGVARQFSAKTPLLSKGALTKAQLSSKIDRFNKVSDFILDSYPKGGVLSKIAPDIDVILDNILVKKDIAGQAIGDIVESVMNNSGSRAQITSLDIANLIDTELLSKFQNKLTGLAEPGSSRQFDAIKSLSDEFVNSDFVLVSGRKKYVPLSIERVRDIRIRLDRDFKVFDKDIPTATQSLGRELRQLIEDKIVSRSIGDASNGLLKEYLKQKEIYSIAIDAQKIVAASVDKAIKKNNFNLFYSLVGLGAGAALGGVPGAVVGAAAGGSLKSVISSNIGNVSLFATRGIAKAVAEHENAIRVSAKTFSKASTSAKNAYIRKPSDSDEKNRRTDEKDFTAELLDEVGFTNKFIDKNSELFQILPETSSRLSSMSLAIRAFLLEKLPKNPYSGNPQKENRWTPSAPELNKYARYREAAINPRNIINQFKSGYLTPESVEVLSVIYPETKAMMLRELMDVIAKDPEIPAGKRSEIFKIFGVQLDSFSSGNHFLEIQGISSPKPQDGGKINSSSPALGKIREKDLTIGNNTVQ